MRGAAVILALALILATVLPFSPVESWWVRAFDFPRLQLAVLSVAWLAFAFAIRLHRRVAHRFLMVAVIACLVYHGYTIYPYTQLAPIQSQDAVKVRPEASLRLLSANVLQTNRDAEALLSIIGETNPDVVLTLETDDWWSEQLSRLQSTYPFVVLQPQENTYGMLLYSKLALVEPEVRFLVQRDIPSIHTKIRLRSGVLLELYGLHPRPPFPSEATESTPRDAELVLIGREVERQTGPVVVMGDLNDVAWSATSRLFRRTSRLLDPRVGRGFYNSFPVNVPFLRFPLDHVFHSDDFRLVEFERLGDFGSDHFPILIHLSYEPRAERVQEAPAQKPDDETVEERKLRKAR